MRLSRSRFMVTSRTLSFALSLLARRPYGFSCIVSRSLTCALTDDTTPSMETVR